MTLLKIYPIIASQSPFASQSKTDFSELLIQITFYFKHKLIYQDLQWKLGIHPCFNYLAPWPDITLYLPSMVLESKLLLSAENTTINIQFLKFPFLMKYKVFKRGKEREETMSLSTAFKVALCHLPDAMPLAAPHRLCSCGCLDRNISLQDTSDASCISAVPGVILAKPPSHPSIEMDNAVRVTRDIRKCLLHKSSKIFKQQNLLKQIGTAKRGQIATKRNCLRNAKD